MPILSTIKLSKIWKVPTFCQIWLTIVIVKPQHIICSPRSYLGTIRSSFVCKRKRLIDKYCPDTGKWRMPLTKIQCAVQAADTLPLPILSLNEFKISGTIEILQEIIARLSLDPHILHDKIVIFKSNYMTVQNIICAIYCK